MKSHEILLLVAVPACPCLVCLRVFVCVCRLYVYHVMHSSDGGVLVQSTGKVRGAVLLRTTYNAVHAAEWWRHMTDLNYATGPGARANEGRSPTTHLTMSGPIRTAHPRLPDQAFPDVLAAMALQEVARRAGPSGAEHSPTCRSRTLFFHVRNLNRTIGVRPRRPLAQAQRVFQPS